MSLLQRLNEKTNKNVGQTKAKQELDTKVSKKPQESDIKIQLHQHVITELKKHKNLMDDEQKTIIENESTSFLNEYTDRFLTFEAKKDLIDLVTNELMGYGPITPLLNDPAVSEIMINGPYQIYIERNGKLTLSDSFFRDDEHVLQVIEKIVSPLGRRIDESSPMVDARLPDGSRVNAIIPPLSLVGPVMTIRKFPSKRLEISR